MGGEKGNGVQQGRVTSYSRVTCTEGQPRLLSQRARSLVLHLPFPFHSWSWAGVQGWSWG